VFKVTSTLWRFDFRQFSYKRLTYIIPILIIGFGLYDTFLDTGYRFVKMSTKLIRDSENYITNSFIEASSLSYFFWTLIVFLCIYITLFAYFCLTESIKNKGRTPFLSILIPHFLTNIVHIIFSSVIVYCIALIAYLITGEFNTDINILEGFEQQLTNFYNNSIPTLISMPYVIALFCTIIFMDLPNYALHWLTHKSRFLWYVVHRSHHTAEIMHPMGTGPVYGFSILMKLPRFLITLAVSKFIYSEPLFLELLSYYFFNILTEKFNHASPFYDFAFRNKLVRFVSAFYGNGVYHYLHHSAKEGEENINISGAFFNFWDRVFGTFVKPRKKKPEVGLTNQPNIILNPFILYFGGLLTIVYELKHNSIKHWFNILLGTVTYKPPKTKDYLIK